MANDNSIRFTLSNNIIVVVKKVTSDKYDFEMFLSDGIRKTFRWKYGDTTVYAGKKGETDKLIQETIETFKSNYLPA